MWTWLKSIEWAHLPDAGGLLDQQEGLMEAIFAYQAFYSYVKEQAEMNEADAKAFGGKSGLPR